MALATALGLSLATVPFSAAARPASAGVVGAVVALAEPGVGEDAEASVPATKAAILPLAVEGDELPAADVEQLTARLVEGLRRGDFEIIDPSAVLGVAPSAASCRDAACYTSIASATGASHVVRAVVKGDDRDYQVEVVLVDGRDGAEVATSADSCQICGVAEVGDLLDAAAATLRTKLDTLSQGPATLVVSSTPVGAVVTIDGEIKGTTPFDAPVLAGKHVLRISLDGYITVEREVTFVEGIEDTQSFALEKVPSRLPPRPWGWVSLGVGVAGIGFAATYAWLDDRQYRLRGKCEVEIDEECPELWNTDWYVFSGAVLGAGLATLGVAILLNSAKRRSKGKVDKGKATATRRPRFGIGPGSVTLHGRF